MKALIHAPATGRLASHEFADVPTEGELGVELELKAQAGDIVDGPDLVFATCWRS